MARLIIPGGGKQSGVVISSPTTNHARLNNLDYEHSGHTGFQAELTFDNLPQANSDNPVKSGGVFTSLAGKADISDVYTKQEVDDEISELTEIIESKQDQLIFDSSPQEDSHNPVESGGLFQIYMELSEGKEDIPKVENISGNSAAGANACSLADIENTLRHYTSGSFSAIEFSIPNTEYPWTYLAEVSFISPATPTQVSYSAAKIINWVGTDCSVSGTYSIFAPVANKHYDIIFYFNGSQFIGLVNGYVPAGGNS